MPTRTVLIAGAGLAGARCAETLRANGHRGRILVVGEEPVAPYERPALSKEFLLGERLEDELLLRAPAFYADQGIELLLGRPLRSVDPGRRTARRGKKELSWDVFVLATGARPRRLPVPAPSGVHVLRTLADARALRAELARSGRFAVVGGGFVGAEVASTARRLGLAVTLLEAGSLPLERILGAEVGRLLADRYRSHGIELRTRAAARCFRAGPNGRLRAIVLQDGSEMRCDTALVSIGVEPAHDLVPRPLPPSTHACGDVAGGPGHWTSAAADAVAATNRILGLDPAPVQPPFFWSDQFGLRLQLVGDTRTSVSVELGGGADAFVARYRSADGRLVAALAANRPAEVGALRRELALAA